MLPLLFHRFKSGNLFPVIFLTLSWLSLIAGPVLTQEKLLRTLTVSGRGVETIPTTLTNVSLGVEVQGKTAQEVQQQVARRSSAVVTLLRSRNVETLQTTGITLNPIYSYNNNVQRQTGYSATNIVSFRVNTTKQVGILLDDAVKAGATRIDGISFVASDPAIAAAQQQALREATQDAQKQANTVLSVLNFTAKEVVSIQVNSASPPEPLIRYRVQQDVSAASNVSTPVVGGEQLLEVSVTLQIRY